MQWDENPQNPWISYLKFDWNSWEFFGLHGWKGPIDEYQHIASELLEESLRINGETWNPCLDLKRSLKEDELGENLGLWVRIGKWGESVAQKWL